MIDDLEANIEEWKMYGGMGILYRGADDVRSRLVEKISCRKKLAILIQSSIMISDVYSYYTV